MLRLPLICAGLAAAAAIVAASSGALADVTNTLGETSGGAGTGPLIIRIERSTSLSQGAAEVIKQTRCLLRWSGEPGKYTKQCSSSVLPH